MSLRRYLLDINYQGVEIIKMGSRYEQRNSSECDKGETIQRERCITFSEIKLFLIKQQKGCTKQF